MRPKSLVLLLLALGCGLVASIGISQVMDRHTKGPTETVETAPIYVAVRNINLGDPIDTSMVSLEEWPEDKVPPGAIGQLADLEGRRPRSAIIQGEPILEGKLLAPGQIADPITSIPRGYRLKTIEVDASTSAAGLLSPGDRVDVELYVKRDERNGIMSSLTKTILQNIRVFAVDQTVQRSPDGEDDRAVAKTISLLLTPEQASKITLASHLGSISLVPRNPDDDQTATAFEYTVDDLLADSGIGDRLKEQVQVDDEEEDGDLLNAIKQHEPPPTPPFVMEIVEAHDVRQMHFDAETGKPIRELNEPQQDDVPATNVSTAKPAPAGGQSLPEFQGNDSMDDFPIDLEPAK